MNPSPLNPNPNRPIQPQLPAKPRRVRGGYKLSAGFNAADGVPIAWTTQRWVRVIEQAAQGPKLVEGLEYGKLGQTKRLEIVPGAVKASVQGRQYRAYDTTLKLTTFTAEQWDQVVGLMADQAMYAAKLLAGELPANIEEIFARVGVRLFPLEVADVQTSCTCGTVEPWCKHACCVAALVADQLASKPFLMFELRGISPQDLMEHVRQRRSMTAAGASAVPIYTPHAEGEHQFKPLEECIETFWDAEPDAEPIDLPMEPPGVSHPLLRRLGPSPFAGARFPLVGLLATCYEMVSKATVDETTKEQGEGSDLGPENTDEPEDDPDA
jgi:uncharacterized Zn finger protein